MLPTPDTSHVPYERVYEPAEDSFLFLDTLSSPSETAFLTAAFPPTDPPPLVLEIGTGSGVVLAFINAHAHTIFGTRHIFTAGVDVNAFACRATVRTAERAARDNRETHGTYLGNCMGDLTTPWRRGEVDVLVFNPPYVPTPEMPSRPAPGFMDAASPSPLDVEQVAKPPPPPPSFEDDSYLLSLSYAGGLDGMETTNKLLVTLPEVLSARGCAYVLLCQQNKPELVKQRMRDLGAEWRAETVGSSGKTAGWEKLQIVRIWRTYTRNS